MDFITNVKIESWTLYSIGIALIVCRLISRRMKLGSWKLQIDDYLMVFAAVCFTLVVITVNEVAVNGSNYMDPDVAAALTPEERDSAIYGSKMTLVLEVSTLSCVWTIKACLLFLYYRLTESMPRQRLAVKWIVAFCVLGYSLVVSLCLGYWCRPIEQYWAVPVQDSQCATYYHHMIFATAWNIASDLMLLAIPIPILIRSQLPLKRKLALCAVLGLGVLNIVIAILNRYYNFANPNDLGYTYFYVAEVGTAIYVGNIPLCWPLIRYLCNGGAWSKSSSGSSGSYNSHSGKGRSADGKKHNIPRYLQDGGGLGASGNKKKTPPQSFWSVSRALSTTWDKMEEESSSMTSTAGATPMGGSGNESSERLATINGEQHLHQHQHQQHDVYELGERGAGPSVEQKVGNGRSGKSNSNGFRVTPDWHHGANSTTVKGGWGQAGSTSSSEDQHTVNVVQTVEISSGRK